MNTGVFYSNVVRIEMILNANIVVVYHDDGDGEGWI